MCAPLFPVMRSTQEQANLRWRLKTGGAVAISIHRSASTRTPQPNKRQSVGAGRVGAIRRDHAARQCCSAAHLGRVTALCTPCSLSGRLFTRCSSDLAAQLNKRTCRTKNACSITRTRRFSSTGAPG